METAIHPGPLLRRMGACVLPSITMLGAIAAISAHAAEPRIEFAAVFAPTESFVTAPEKPLREDLCLNGRWQFQPVALPAGYHPGAGTPPVLPAPDPGKWEATPIKIPSPWNVNTWGTGRYVGKRVGRPYVPASVYYPSYPAEWDEAPMGWLRRSFTVPAGWAGRRIILHFEAVAGEAQVLVNGQAVGTHFDSFLPFDLDITGLVKPGGGENELLVGVRKSLLFNIISPDYPKGQQRTYPNGSNMDNLAGIWNDVFLLGLPPVRVEDVFIQPQVDKGLLLAEITLRNDGSRPRDVNVQGSVSPWVNLAGKDVLEAPLPNWRLAPAVMTLAGQQVSVPAGSTVKVALQAAVAAGKLKLWSPDEPNLYGLTVDVNAVPAPDAADRTTPVLDRKYTRFGWRQYRINGRYLELNGKRLQLWGDLGHPFGPFIGSRRYIWGDYRMIKDMGGNNVRLHANVEPRAWTDLADEMGLCVLDETSIFGSSINLNLSEPVTWERFERHVDGLVLRDRNHPSVLGWSVANEMFALFFHVNAKAKADGYARLKELARRPLRLDPTRQWVSVDGDQDLEGTLPVWSRHMGIGLPKDVPDIDKPRIFGEHGGTYYAAPPRLKEIGGDLPYESYAARNEVLAFDLYRMITQCAKPELAAFSPSEMVWFGLEHLPFGYRTDARAPDESDGVFFPNYVEGAPGVQPERLPPYVTTINPGFDAALPLYKPLAMFHAMKAALDPRGPQPGPFDHPPVIVERKQPAATNALTSVGFVGDTDGALYGNLYALGLPLVTGEKAASAALLVIDGETVDAAGAKAAKSLADTLWAKGGRVWVMLRGPGAALTSLKDLFPAEVTLTDRQATSLVRGAADPAIDGFNLSDLYFVGETDPCIQKAGLDGALVQAGKVLLSACNTDWSQFDRQPEVSKCVSTLIYEHLGKPPGAALVAVPRGTGTLWVSTLDATRDTPGYEVFWTQLFKNAGVRLDKPPQNWLVPLGRAGRDAVWRYTSAAPVKNFSAPAFDDSGWQTGPAPFGAGEARTSWTTPEIGLRKEFSTAQVPRSAKLVVRCSGDVEILLNGTKVFTEKGGIGDYRTEPLSDTGLKALKAGRNVLAVRCVNGGDAAFLDVGLSGSALPSEKKNEHDLLLDGPPQ